MPYYKIAYSIAFVVILSAIQPVVYANEIGQAVERAVSLLAVVFCADTYLVEVQSKRSEVFCLYNLKKQAALPMVVEALPTYLCEIQGVHQEIKRLYEQG